MALSILDIKSWADVRAFVHATAPGLGATLMTGSVLLPEQQGLVAAIVGLIAALTSPTLSTLNTADGFRRYFYPVLGALGGVLATIGLVGENVWSFATAIVVLFLTGGVGSANTPTTSSWSIKADPYVVAARAPIAE